jgi:thioredoxin reductase (NADPH)
MNQPDITLYGAHWCPDCRRAKKFLGEQQVEYKWVDIEEDPEAVGYVERVNKGKRIIPTIVFGDGSILVEPTNAELATKLGLDTKARLDFYDLIIVGAGPAGLTASIYAAREGIETLLIERSAMGGQSGITQRIDNYPGFPDGISGADFADRVVGQAERFGVEILRAQEVKRLEVDSTHRHIYTAPGTHYCAKAVLIATGAKYRRLNVPGEDGLIGAGIHFCATCDGPFYKGKPLIVIGGGNSAAEEGLFLTQFASDLTMLVRGDALSATKTLAEKILDHDAIDILWNTEAIQFQGKDSLESVLVRNSQTGEQSELRASAVFLFIGMTPNSELVRDLVDVTEHGYVVTGHDLRHRPQPLPFTPRMMETSIAGVFAAGDVRLGSTQQITSAAGEGTAAALSIRDYLKTV